MPEAMRYFLGVLAFAALAFAADVTGTWKGQFEDPDGNKHDITFHFKQSADQLTGTVAGPHGDVSISEGKMDGDNVSFVVGAGQNGGMKITHTGKVNGNEMRLALKAEGDGGGGPEGMTITLKKQ